MTRGNSASDKAIESESDSTADGPNEMIFFLIWDKSTKNFEKFQVEGDKVFEDFQKGYYLTKDDEGISSAKRLRVTVEVVE